MAKGKNHDRKASASFGKVKSSAQKGEFNMKRIKGQFFFPSVYRWKSLKAEI